jgi:hypothetical protein
VAPGEKQSDGDSADSSGVKNSALLNKMPCWLASALFHCIAMLVLAMISLAERPDPRVVQVDGSVIDAVEDVSADLKVDLPEIDSSSDSALSDLEMIVSENDDASALLAAAEADSPEFVDFDQLAGQSSDQLGGGKWRRNGSGDGAKFFESIAAGRKFVFLLDNSNSMINGRFETARAELIKSVEALDPHQMFYVILFSDTAYSLHWPKPAERLVWATTENKKQLAEWANSVELCFGTNAEKAMRRAIEMKPDAIYVLSDGAFMDDPGGVAAEMSKGSIRINTLGMLGKKKAAKRGRDALTKLASDNGGTFTNVKVDADLAAKSRANPIPKHRRRGEVWGVTLRR